jgi:hypothetical protein
VDSPAPPEEAPSIADPPEKTEKRYPAKNPKKSQPDPDETPSIANNLGESEEAPSIESQSEPDLHYRLGRIFKAAVEYSLDPSRRHTDRGQSLLDETIFSMRKRGVAVKEIHRLINKDRLGADGEPAISQAEIIESLERSLAGYAEMSGTEYRALQIARLEDVLKMAYEYAEAGNPAHVQMLIASIERLNKMFELESERTVIEVQLVSGQQAGVLLSILDVALTVLLADPLLSQAIKQLTAKSKDPAYFDRLVSQAMDAAEATVIEATGSTLSIDLQRETIIDRQDQAAITA